MNTRIIISSALLAQLALAGQTVEHSITKKVYDHSWSLAQKTSKMTKKLLEGLELLKFRFENVSGFKQNREFLQEAIKEHNENFKDLLKSSQHLSVTLLPKMHDAFKTGKADRYEAFLAANTAKTSLEHASSLLKIQLETQKAYLSILEKGVSLTHLETLLELLEEIQRNNTKNEVAI